MLFAEILEAKQMKMTVYRLRQRMAVATPAGGVCEADAASATVDVSDVVLSDPEKVAILKHMEEEVGELGTTISATRTCSSVCA